MAKYAFNILAGVDTSKMKTGFNNGIKYAKKFTDSAVQNFALVARGAIPLSAGVKNVGESFKALLKNPVALVIVAIVGAFKMMHSALGKSAEGQRILAAGSAILTGVMQTLTNITTDLAGFFIKLFKDPKTAMADFGKSLKTAVMAPIHSMMSGVKFLGKALSKLFKGDVDGAWEAAKSGAKEFGKAIGSANPVLIIGKKLTEDIGDNMSASVKLAKREHDLYEKTTKWLTKKADLERIIAEERRKLTERGQTVEEQQASEVRLSQAIGKLYAGNSELMT
ncbi:MAG: hypothetical protein PF444_02070, partial [Bacteroidales bacterium]|nr:hypothetical protein [Bacteroidales bacterium]